MEVVTNKYVLSAIGAVLALLFTYMYDKFEKKDYSYMQYIKMAIVGYIVSLVSVVVTGYAMGLEGNNIPLPFTISDTTTTTTQTGGTTVSQSNGVTVDSLKPVNLSQTPAPAPAPPVQPKSVTVDTLDFRTGTPTF